MTAPAVRLVHRGPRRVVPTAWQPVAHAAPQLAETMLAYLDQIAVSLRPATVKAVSTDLRVFARFLIEHHPDVVSVAAIGRSHIEAFKLWQHAQPGRTGSLKSATFRRRFGLLRMFFVRITEWGGRCTSSGSDLLR
jgi:site-specific recombinase XerD